jgi:hypothetical protein
MFKRSQTHPSLVVDSKANMTENWLMLDGKVCRQSKASDHESVCSTVPERFKHIRDTTHAWVCWHGLEEWQMKLAADFLLNIVGYRGAWNSDGLSGPQPLAGGDMVAQGASSSGLPRPIPQPFAGGGGVGAQGASSSELPRPMAQPLAGGQGCGKASFWTLVVVVVVVRRPSSWRARLWPAEYPESRRLLEVSHCRKSHSRRRETVVSKLQDPRHPSASGVAVRFCGPAVDVKWQSLQCWSVIGAEARRVSRALGRSSERGGR